MGTSEIRIAALVGVALLWAGGVVLAAVARRRQTGVQLGMGLLAGAWVAGVFWL